MFVFFPPFSPGFVLFVGVVTRNLSQSVVRGIVGAIANLLQGLDQGFDGLFGFQVSKSACSSLSETGIRRILKHIDQGFDGAPVADLAQSTGGILANVYLVNSA